MKRCTAVARGLSPLFDGMAGGERNRLKKQERIKEVAALGEQTNSLEEHHAVMQSVNEK